MKRTVFSLLTAALTFCAPARCADKPTAPTISLEELNQIIGGPTLISLHFKNAPAMTVFRALAQQAKMEIKATFIDPAKDLRPVSIDIDEQPFWLAVRQVCAQSGAELYQGFGKDIIIAPNGDLSLSGGPFVQHGPIMVVAASTRREKRWQYFAPAGPSATKRETQREIQLTIIVDPKLRLLSNLPPLRFTTAVDEKGRTIFQPKSGISANGTSFTLNAHMRFGSTVGFAESQRLAKLTGQTKLFLALGMENWQIDDVLQAKNAMRVVQRGGEDVSYALLGVRPTDQNYEVRLSIARREFAWQNQDQVPAAGDFQLRVHLYDAQNREFRRATFAQRVEENADTVFLTVPFARGSGDAKDQSGIPQKLVVEIPRMVRAVELPFEFTDLPLP